MKASKIGTSQLFPPKIKHQTKPIQGADIGVPLHALVPYPGAIFRMAEVTLDPFFAGSVDEGDEVELWAIYEALPGKGNWNTNLPPSAKAPILLDTTTIKDVNAAVALFISEGQFYYGVVTRLYYIIRRGSDNIGESQPLTFIYNLIRPGLKDRYTVPGGHSELKLLLPDSIKNGVGPDFVSAQIRFQYPYCRAYDVISLICNGEMMDFMVSPDSNNAPAPPSHGSETPSTVEFTVDKAFLMKAKRENNELDFLFTVHDQLLNFPDPDAPRSPPQTVVEDLDGLLFLKAILREIEGDTTDEPEIIDLKKLAKNDLTVAILTADARIEVGDEIEGIYTATRTGYPDVVEPLNGTVEKGDFEPKKTCILKVPNHKVILGSSVTVTYEVKRNSVPVGRSQTSKAQVVGTYFELKPPSVLQAGGATLDPMAALTKLTVVVPQGNTLPTDLLSICWTAKPGTHAEGSIITKPKPISEIGLNINVPPGLMAFCLGDTVTVSYIITRDGEELPSEILTLTVQDPPQSALTSPRLKEADADGTGPELNLAKLTPEGKMWCPGFPLIAEDQFVWLFFKGTNADGTLYEKYIWAAPFAFVNAQWVKDGFFEAVAPYEDLMGLLDGSSLTIEMFIAFGKSEDLALAKRFMVRTYTVSAVEDVAPRIESVKDIKNREIINGGITVHTSVTLIGSATNGQKVDIYNNKQLVEEVVADGVSGKWTLFVTGLIRDKHSFVAKAKYGTGQSSAPRELTVTALITPTLDNVLDDRGVEIPEGKTTASTRVTLKGEASKGQKVQIFDADGTSSESKGEAAADGMTGKWMLPVLGLKLGRHSFNAVALYEDDYLSTSRTLSIVDYLEENFDNLPDGPVSETPLIFLSGTLSIASHPTVYPGNKVLHSGNVGLAPQLCRMNFKEAFKKVTFTMHSNTFRAPGTILVYRGTSLIKNIPLSYHLGPITDTHDFTDAQGIDRIEISGSYPGSFSSFYIDNVRMYR
ncbi:hypothetical protein HU724_014290 [Pseudomonas iranensis]|uniref:hypothetical protein n=1 Tax=Pseudomonas iranensis TaxID=2745503 RepID=UPI00164624DC|nr:hypothetical protein [Pseudomonas iranensis]QXI20213.1 hypothetical protein HU724_014290 [Pseudomonas iranensis]